MNHEPQILDLDKVLAEKAPKIYNKVPRFAINYLKRKIHLDELNEILTIYADKYGVDFMQAVVGYFNLTLETSGLENIQDEKVYICFKSPVRRTRWNLLICGYWRKIR
jgi:hypothetical protein